MTATAAPALEHLSDLVPFLQSSGGYRDLLVALREGRAGTVDGAWGSSAPLALAALGGQCPGTLLIAIAHPRDLDAWATDLTSFYGTSPLLFPAWDSLPSADSDQVDEIGGQRLRVLRQLENDLPPRILLASFQALMQPVPERQRLLAGKRTLKVGVALELEPLTDWLLDHGYRRAEVVELPGEFSRRGGILDVFPPDADDPIRVELFGDEVESLRRFNAGTQRSLGTMNSTDLLALSGGDAVALTGHLCEYLPADSWTAYVELEELAEQGKHYLERVASVEGLFTPEGVFQQLTRRPSIRVATLPAPTVEATWHMRVESVERFSGDVARVRDELDSIAVNDQVIIACPSEAECKRLGEVLGSGQLAQSGRLRVVTGRVRAGFRMVENGLVVLGGQELFHRDQAREVQPRRRLESRAIDSFLELAEGDLVVHVSHGIARYRGMNVLEKHGRQEEYLSLEFRDGVVVYVPASKIDLVQKYVGGSKVDPELSKIGGTTWANRKKRVEEAVLDLASEMIDLQAVRAAQPGISFLPDSEWQAEFEATFPYQETPDQLTSLVEIKRDMEQARPMDRLICGDVGYGKTELAIRAAFKCIDNGRQVAVLVPTTVLAEQHFRTFSQRLAEYPFVVEALSRFRSGGEQRRIVQRLAEGSIDVVIGTHRIVSADVKFKDLGLVIIDEEQRFGVDHKERLKRLRQKVDVLTMTATPIPRTLHLSLLGIRDISNLETPPPDRLAIETRVVRFDPALIRNAILRELNREGQVYFVHNRVQDIHQIAAKLKKSVPEARFVIGHGQMTPEELEQAMVQFVRRDADVLVATTIIESGLDIPNANTIFINEAENYGLADMHQLRGRVGRYKHRAYAYLLLEGNKQLSPTAARRLKAIEEYTELGAGFKIALRDLEIRGAGNILGTQQSGHIAAVGYELYCEMLENAVRRLKNEPLKTPLEINLDLPWRAFLPRQYVAGQRQRIEVYRRLSRVRSLHRLEDFRQEMRDRFGPLPEPAEWLLRQAEIRLLAARWHIARVRLETAVEGGPIDMVLEYRSPRRMEKLAKQSGGELRVVDESSAYMRMPPGPKSQEELYERLRRVLVSRDAESSERSVG
jgi:transcription-repair coupling factor (superfamily II helicase)